MWRFDEIFCEGKRYLMNKTEEKMHRGGEEGKEKNGRGKKEGNI